jgi:hypothetical protein
MGNFFVMLNHPRGTPVPMMDIQSDDEIAWFKTERQARSIAEQNPLGDAYGFEIFKLGEGRE